MVFPPPACSQERCWTRIGREGFRVLGHVVVAAAASLTDPLLGSGEPLRCGRTTRLGSVLQISQYESMQISKHANIKISKYANEQAHIQKSAILP